MFDSKVLIQLTQMEMPYGKYKGRMICDLPEHYLLWHQRKGWPKGHLGELLELMTEIRLNGLEHLIHQIKSLNNLIKKEKR